MPCIQDYDSSDEENDKKKKKKDKEKKKKKVWKYHPADIFVIMIQ